MLATAHRDAARSQIILGRLVITETKNGYNQSGILSGMNSGN